MAKPQRPLSGSAKDAWLKRQVMAGGSLDDVARRLQGGIASLKPREPLAAHEAASHDAVSAAGGEATGSAFDPFTPNVIVLVRTRGAPAARAALDGIGSSEQLRLLARAQQLSVEDGIADRGGLIAAIVAAAERRIANRRAAAS